MREKRYRGGQRELCILNSLTVEQTLLYYILPLLYMVIPRKRFYFDSFSSAERSGGGGDIYDYERTFNASAF